MPYWQAIYHVVWSTWGRVELIEAAWEPDLYRVIAAKVVELTGRPCVVGGTANHVHLLCAIPPHIAASKVIVQAKGASAHLMNRALERVGAPFWQGEYGLFTVSPAHEHFIRGYVLRQQEHHRQDTVISALEVDGQR